MNAAVTISVSLVGFLLAPGIAHATCTSLKPFTFSSNVEVCINYTPDFADTGNGEDHWTTNGTARTAQGIRIKIFRNSNGAVLWGGSSGDYLDLSGCVTLPGLISSGPYTIRAYSQAKILEASNYNLVDVRASESNDDRFYIDLSTSFNPTSNLTCTYTWNNSSSGTIEGGGVGTTADVVNILAGASFSVGQHDGGLASKTFKIFNEPCPVQSGSCTTEGTSSRVDIFFSEEGRSKKFIIAHEMGHGVQFLTNGGEPSINSSSESADPCDRDDDGNPTSHTLVSKESQGRAATEGFAHFWSAAVWNSRAGPDCRFAYYKSIDLDQDGTEEPAEFDPWVSCVDSLDPTSYPHQDYMHNKCSSGFAGKAVELDWMRALFNMYLAEDFLSTTDIIWIWDAADPHTWDPDEAAPGTDSPYERLSDAANNRLDYDHELVWYWFSSLHGTDE